MGGEAAIPYHIFRLLRERGIETHLVGQARNRDELSAAFDLRWALSGNALLLVVLGLFPGVLLEICSRVL